MLGVYVRRWELFEGERGDEGREMWRALDEQLERRLSCPSLSGSLWQLEDHKCRDTMYQCLARTRLSYTRFPYFFSLLPPSASTGAFLLTDMGIWSFSVVMGVLLLPPTAETKPPTGANPPRTAGLPFLVSDAGRGSWRMGMSEKTAADVEALADRAALAAALALTFFDASSLLRFERISSWIGAALQNARQ